MGAAFGAGVASGCRRVPVTGESILACRPGGAELQFRHFPLAPGSMLACEISDPHVAGKKAGDVVVVTTDMEVETERMIKDGWI